MKKCDDCIIGSGQELYFDYGGESFIFESSLEDNNYNVRNWEILSLFNFCPECGNKNNLKRFEKFLNKPLEDFLLSGKVL